MVTETSPDAALLEAWTAGDQDAGRTLVTRHLPAMRRFFVAKVRRGAEDLVQDTFLRAVEGVARLRESASFRAFLFGIARNVLFEHWREAHGPSMDVGARSLADLRTSPTTFVARLREHRALLEALRTIPLDSQIALELYYWEGTSTADLAEILGIPRSTVKGRLARARALLQQAMMNVGGEALGRTTADDVDRWASEIREIVDRELR